MRLSGAADARRSGLALAYEALQANIRCRMGFRFSLARAVFREEFEQALVAEYLPAKGFFVEVGAFHPVFLSQTWMLEQRGWDGLLIEPIPAQAEHLRRDRRARVFQVACGNPQQHGCIQKMSVRGALSSFRVD
jgi:hypothetical protein